MTTDPTQDEVLALFDSLSNWGRWGGADVRGTLNHITPAVRAAAAAQVHDGVTISCALEIDPRPGPDFAVLHPPMLRMLETGEGVGNPDRVPSPLARSMGPRVTYPMEYIGMVFHGSGITHLDGLSHVIWDGRLYNDRPAATVTAWKGATVFPITDVPDGIVTRGVLLDLARWRGVDWLEAGDGPAPDDLDAIAASQAVTIQTGDAVLLRTGFGRRRKESPPSEPGRPGWRAASLPWLHAHEIALIGADTAQDATPSGYADLRQPVHVVGINAMGLWLLDNADLEALAETCARLGRWEFLFTVAPLRMKGGTGSPVNPLALF